MQSRLDLNYRTSRMPSSSSLLRPSITLPVQFSQHFCLGAHSPNGQRALKSKPNRCDAATFLSTSPGLHCYEPFFQSLRIGLSIKEYPRTKARGCFWVLPLAI